MIMRKPPGISDRDFAAALGHFETVVGRKWLFTSDEDLDLYRDAFSPYWGEPEERRASAAVAPERVEQVQEIVRIANRLRRSGARRVTLLARDTRAPRRLPCCTGTRSPPPSSSERT